MNQETMSCIRVYADVEQIKAYKMKIDQADDSIQLLANAFSLAGNDVRLKILYLLHQESNLCVCDLSDVLGMGISAISQHLRKLKDGNLVKAKKVGQTIFYSMNADYDKLFEPYFALIARNQLFSQDV